MIYVRLKSDPHKRRWKVRKYTSLRHVYEAIVEAMAFGSIGGTIVCEDWPVGKQIILAEVIQVNSDNTERKPYALAY